MRISKTKWESTAKEANILPQSKSSRSQVLRVWLKVTFRISPWSKREACTIQETLSPTESISLGPTRFRSKRLMTFSNLNRSKSSLKRLRDQTCRSYRVRCLKSHPLLFIIRSRDFRKRRIGFLSTLRVSRWNSSPLLKKETVSVELSWTK